MEKILLAYSGGLDTSCILAWLKEQYGVPVIAYCCDVGQGDDRDALRRKALATGAAACIIDDRREEFVREYVFRAIKANALYEGTYYLGTSLARPCIAQGMIAAALEEGCTAIAHGATGKGNDQVRFELAVKALAPHLPVIAPWREWQYTARSELFGYARERGIPVPVSVEKPYSMDANLMHISYEGGILEDPWRAPAEDMFVWTQAPENAPSEPDIVDIDFESGVPVAVNGRKGSPVEILVRANELGARHGIGRVDCVENRYVGIKSRGVYETPGVTLLMQAHRAVESITLDREVARLLEGIAPKFGELVYYGYWFSPEMDLLRSMIDRAQETVTGTARLKLYRGSSTVLGRRAPASLYQAALSSFETATRFSPRDAAGFININGLRLSTWNEVHAGPSNGIPATAAQGGQ